MEIRNITSFLKVAELQNISKAAELLNYTQSTITFQIKQLEDELGIQLFDRIGKKVSLTEHGKNFVTYAQEVLSSVNKAKLFLGNDDDEPTGVLRIGSVESLNSSILGKILSQFYSDYPKIETVIRQAEDISRLPAMLNNGEVDLIFFAGKEVFDSKWVTPLSRKADLVFIVRAGHHLAGKRVSVADIVKHPFILSKKGFCFRYDLEQFLASKNLSITPHLETCNIPQIVDVLQDTNSISFLPKYTVRKYIENKEIDYVDVYDANIQTCVQVIYHNSKTLNGVMRAFVSTVENYYRSFDMAVQS